MSLAAALCSGCGDNVSPTAPTPVEPGANRSPSASGSIPEQVLGASGKPATLDVALYFTDPDGDALAYTAVSSNAGVVIASVSGSTVVLNPLSAGSASATVTATDPDGLTATQGIAVTVTQGDAHGDTRDTATPVSPDSSTEGALEGHGDVDYYGLTFSSPETLTVETIGGTDTFGQLESQDGAIVASADGGGSGGNFRIERQVQAGSYYVRVSGATPTVTGHYTLMLSRAPSPDLVVESAGVSSASLEPEASFTLSATVRNQRGGSAAATTLRYYRSTDAAVTTSDTEVGTDAVGALTASATSSESINLTAPATAGTYYYGACVDSVAGESDTTNNCSASVQVTVSAPPPPPPTGPDLRIYAIVASTSPSGTLPGGSITLSAGVGNFGDESSAATTLRFYQSTDATITTADTQVGTDAVGVLSAGATSSSESITITAPATAGTYYYGACVDSVAGESDTTNNCSVSVPVTVSAPPVQTSPDLTVGLPSVTDSTPDTGESFTLSATVSNDGDGGSAATTLRYYRSTDATITTSDTEEGTNAVGALAASATSSESISLTAPSSAGTYYYGACADSVAGESDTTNNCSSSVQVTVSAPPVQTSPDLTVGSPSVTDNTPDTGGSFTLSATVSNDGDGGSAATTLRYYRSTDATITTSDTEEGTDAVGALAASATSSESISLTAPATAGTYYYGACADSVAGESDTTNNCSSSVQVTVSAPPVQTSPDLTVGSPSVTDSTPDTGGSFTLSATVSNDGDGGSAATTLRYYRSTDATITTSDTEEGTNAVGALAASATSSESISLTAPSSAGTYYYGACADSVAGESDTTNNCSGSVQVTVSAPPVQTGPDLDITAIVISRSPFGTPPGASLNMSVGVANQGSAASPATTLRYYRSTDVTITTSDTEEATDAVEGLAASGTVTLEEELFAPSTAGTYFYGACVDSVAGESDTTNNCSVSVPVTVSEPPVQTSPDLTVGSPSVTDSAPDTGESITLSATVSNDGDGSSAATTLRYYRSTDATVTTSDTEVGTDAVRALAASATSSESIGLTAPATAGTYYYGACVDSVASESDTTNNCSGSVQVTVSAPPVQTSPDLTVGSPSVTDSTPDTGESFTLSATVSNDGDGSSAATTLRYYRSTDATVTTSDTEVGTDAVGALAASATSSESIGLTAPATAGTYYYGACVDSVAGESDTTNNCSVSVPVTVSEPPVQTSPDLTVGSPSVTDSAPDTGESITLSATVSNDGDGSSAATTLRYYRSTDATVTTSDTEVGTDAVGALAASATSSESIGLTAPATAGTYYYGACVDSVASESDTTNNCSGSVQVTVSAPPVQTSPDLTVGSPSVTDSTPDTGESFTLSATVSNDGDGSSAATTLRYYRSTDATVTTSDTEVGTDAVGALAASATSSESIGLTAPATAGTYYYGACADSVAGESDTTNNCSGSVQVTVSEPPVQTSPDLTVGSPSVTDSTPDTGGSFTLSATVSNDGDGGSAATTLRYYRSTDATITTSDTEEGTNAVGALAASATSSESISLTAPSSAGTYYYGACADSVAGESDTTNNCSGSVQVTVSAPPVQTGPDLDITAIVIGCGSSS